MFTAVSAGGKKKGKKIKNKVFFQCNHRSIINSEVHLSQHLFCPLLVPILLSQPAEVEQWSQEHLLGVCPLWQSHPGAVKHKSVWGCIIDVDE